MVCGVGQLSNLLWAMGKSGFGDARAFSAAHDALLELRAAEAGASCTAGGASGAGGVGGAGGAGGMSLQGLSGQSLALTLWAFANVGRATPSLLAAVEAELLRRGLRDLCAPVPAPEPA
jgi:hypothetical protein